MELLGGVWFDKYVFKKWNCRSLGKVQNECTIAKQLGDLFGPFPDMLAAQSAINAFYKYKFDIKLGKRYDGTSLSGPKQLLECTGSLTNKCRCTFKIRYELVTNSETFVWYIFSIVDTHASHSWNPTESKAQILSNANNRSVPNDLKNTALLMYNRNIPVADIYGVLIDILKSRNEAAQFLKEDIYNMCRRELGDQTIFDASNVLQYLESRKCDFNLPFNYQVIDGKLSSLFVVLNPGLKYLKLSLNILFFDTTFNTNKWGAKLGLFTTVSASGATILLGLCLISGEETSEKFIWAFERFLYYFHVPSVVMTDSCLKIAAAINSTSLAASLHLLCIWHIFKNFTQNLSWFCNKVDWVQVCNCFWKITRATDWRSINNFDEEFEELFEVLKRASETMQSELRDPRRFQKSMDWFLHDLKQKSRQWAYRFYSGTFTCGAHSTQRGESQNSAVKQTVTDANASLVSVVSGLDNYTEGREIHVDIGIERYFNDLVRNKAVIPPILSAVQQAVHRYAFKQLQLQYSQKDFYTFEASSFEGIEGYLVWRSDEVSTIDVTCSFDSDFGVINSEAGIDCSIFGKQTRFCDNQGRCSCNFFASFGISCRHILCILDAKMKTAPNDPICRLIRNQLVSDFWRLEVAAQRETDQTVVINVERRLPSGDNFLDTFRGLMQNLETVGTKQPIMRPQIISTLKSLTSSINLKVSGSSSSEFVHVANMDKVDKCHTAGRPSGSTNNSKATGLVTFGTDFSKLTSAVLKEVLKLNGISSSGNKQDLLEKLKTIPKDTFIPCSTTGSSSSSSCTKRKIEFLT